MPGLARVGPRARRRHPATMLMAVARPRRRRRHVDHGGPDKPTRAHIQGVSEQRQGQEGDDDQQVEADWQDSKCSTKQRTCGILHEASFLGIPVVTHLVYSKKASLPLCPPTMTANRSITDPPAPFPCKNCPQPVTLSKPAEIAVDRPGRARKDGTARRPYVPPQTPSLPAPLPRHGGAGRPLGSGFSRRVAASPQRAAKTHPHDTPSPARGRTGEGAGGGAASL